jgi:Ubiquitin-activating enzyme E1 FCCH domain
VEAVSKRNFTRGIFSPVVQARRDVDAWQAGAARLTNVTLMKHGGVRKRQGTELVYVQCPDDDETRMLPFTFSTGQSYALLFGQATMRPLALGGAVLSEGFGITAISRANPGVVTAPFHGLATGAEVFLAGVEGMTQVNGRVFKITVINDDNFSIGIDTTGFDAFTADDGTVRVGAPAPTPTPPTVPAPTPSPTPAPTVPPGGGGGGEGRPTRPGQEIP